MNNMGMFLMLRLMVIDGILEKAFRQVTISCLASLRWGSFHATHLQDTKLGRDKVHNMKANMQAVFGDVALVHHNNRRMPIYAQS
jgi:hypothetical protein